MKKTIILTLLLITTMLLNIENTFCYSAFPYHHNNAASDDYIYNFELLLHDGIASESDVYDAIANQNYLTPQGLDCFLMHGNIPSYIDDLIAVGRLPQDYTMGSLGGASHPSYNYDPLGIRGESSANTTPSVEQTTPTTPVIPTTPADPTPTLDESKAGIYVVVNEAVKSYETYNKETVVDTWAIGTQVDVKGLMSNGYYKVVKAEKEQYIDKGNLVPLDKYEAAWEETERVDSTCGKAGSVTYTNTISSETKTEVLEPLEHDYKIIDQIAPTCTEKGLKTFECSVCDLETVESVEPMGHTNDLICKECNQIIIMDNAVPLGVLVGVVIVVIGISVFWIKKHKK